MARSPPQAPYKRAAGEEKIAIFMLIYTIFHDFSRSDSAPSSARSDQNSTAAAATAAAAAAAFVLLLLLLLHHRCCAAAAIHAIAATTCDPRGLPRGSRQRCHCRPAATLLRPPPAARPPHPPHWLPPSSSLAAAKQAARRGVEAQHTCRRPHCAHRTRQAMSRKPGTKKTAERQSTGRGTTPKLRARLIAHSQRQRALPLPPPSSRRTRRIR